MVAIVATPLRAQPWTPVKEGATLQPHILQVFSVKTKPRNVYTLQAKHATAKTTKTPLKPKNFHHQPPEISMMTKSVSQVCQGLRKRILEEAVEASPVSRRGAEPAGIMVAIVATPHRAQLRRPVKVQARHQPDILC